MFEKHFKIKKEERVTGILPYRIFERYTMLFVIHWWSVPTFAPPHLFDNYMDAYNYIIEQCPNAVIESNIPFEI